MLNMLHKVDRTCTVRDNGYLIIFLMMEPKVPLHLISVCSRFQVKQRITFLFAFHIESNQSA